MEKLTVHNQERKGREKCDSKTWSCSEPSGSAASFADPQNAGAQKLLGMGAWESDDWAVASEAQRPDASDTPCRAYPMSDRVPQRGDGTQEPSLNGFPL